MILSICICALNERAGKLALLLASLEKQIKDPEQVELVVEMDDRQITTGAKRNLLYQRAKGKYVCSIDDDDEVYPYYVEEILKAVENDPDAIAMNGIMSINGKFHASWSISRFNPYIETRVNGKPHYLRYHNHLSPIRRSIALQFPFPDKVFQEDYEFATALHKAKAIKIETRIDKPMYHYKKIQK